MFYFTFRRIAFSLPFTTRIHHSQIIMDSVDIKARAKTLCLQHGAQVGVVSVNLK